MSHHRYPSRCHAAQTYQPITLSRQAMIGCRPEARPQGRESTHRARCCLAVWVSVAFAHQLQISDCRSVVAVAILAGALYRGRVSDCHARTRAFPLSGFPFIRGTYDGAVTLLPRMAWHLPCPQVRRSGSASRRCSVFARATPWGRPACSAEGNETPEASLPGMGASVIAKSQGPATFSPRGARPGQFGTSL
ncbi:hypothetical protein BD414DRAFT_109260 [Trametes punicea]|nr:hypothetical protein BD414DRAFT_109260 [Trametes punicea]